MVKPIIPVPIRPMPKVSKALVYLPDLQAAVNRAGKAWNKTQLEDALASAKNFIKIMEQSLEN